MYSIVFLAFTAFALCYALTPIVAAWSRRRGILDRPGIRRTHKAPTPRTGGIAIALAYVAPIGILMMSPLNAADSINLPAVVRLLPSALAVFLIGLDRKSVV